jgi:hypothetical protein
MQQEIWKQVWHEGFVPVLSTPELKALRTALANDDPRLTQGSTTTPPPLMCIAGWACEAACALGFCGWQGDDMTTVGEVEEFFARKCFEADEKLGEPAACRHFLNFFDDTPRTEMIAQFLPEVELALSGRATSDTQIVPVPVIRQAYLSAEDAAA